MPKSALLIVYGCSKFPILNTAYTIGNTQLGKYFKLPIGTWSPEMNVRINAAITKKNLFPPNFHLDHPTHTLLRENAE